MKDNEVVEVLDDGTIYYFDLDVCNREAEDAILELANKQDVLPNYDFNATVYSLFVQSVSILQECGWTSEELVEEVMSMTIVGWEESDEDDDDEEDPDDEESED